VANEIAFQDWMILYLDVLGQGHKLRGLTGIPTTEEEKAQFVSVLKTTLGVVLTLRDSFRRFFDEYSRESGWVSQLPEAQRAKMRQLRKAEVSYSGFSDSIIVAVPLSNHDEHCASLNGIYSALVAACGLPLFAMAAGQPLRGGVDVGVGTRLNTGEIYGAGLERAYSLESSLADYPRIVVGRELIRYLKWVSAQEPKTDFGRLAILTAERCQRLICQDTDGWPILDFLGAGLREAVANNVDPKAVEQAYEFAKRQYAGACEKGDQKLMSRYFRLLRYFDARRASSGIS